MDQRDLTMSILDQFNHISQDVGDFTAGILSNDITKEDQIAFMQRIVSLAVTIRDRAEGTAGLVVERSVIDEGSASAGRESQHNES
ncbi:MAG: hypothetical protein M3Y48_23275 [Actinomycetota bacterium]|nr:hypothetical protein [Actinomycetota bacterium]